MKQLAYGYTTNKQQYQDLIHFGLNGLSTMTHNFPLEMTEFNSQTVSSTISIKNRQFSIKFSGVLGIHAYGLQKSRGGDGGQNKKDKK